MYTCIYIQCNTSPKFLFNYNKQTKPKDFENIIHEVPVYRHSGPSLQITFDQIRNWTGTQQRFSRGGPNTNWMDQLAWNFIFQWQREERGALFSVKRWRSQLQSLLICVCWIQVQIRVNGLHFPEIYTLRPYAAQSVSEQHSHAISGLLVPWKNVPSNLCWFRCSELHVPETVCQAVTLPSETGFVGLSGLSLGRSLLQGLLHRKCSLYLLKGKCAFIFYSNHEKLLFFLSNYFWSDLGI